MPLEALERDELRTPASPLDLDVRQITSDTDRASQSIYFDTPSWSADSTRFVFLRSASRDGAKKAGVWLCDVANGCEIRPVVEFDAYVQYMAPKPEKGSYGCLLAPDGQTAWHFTRCRDVIEARRRDLATSEETIVVTAPAPYETYNQFGRSADGERISLECFLGDGKTEGAPWGLYIFDLVKGEYSIVEVGNGCAGMHSQYSLNPDPAHSHDVLLQAQPDRMPDGSWRNTPDGNWPMNPDGSTRSSDSLGTALLVIRDDGTDWRMVPIGRDPGQINSHQGWRGPHNSVVASTYMVTPERWRAPMIEATPIPCETQAERWLGMNHPRARQVDLSRRFGRADTCHLGMDASGRHVVADTEGYNEPRYCYLYVGTYMEPHGEAPYYQPKYLLLPRVAWKDQRTCPHAYLSPDGRHVVFMSIYTGLSQVYVAGNFEYP